MGSAMDTCVQKAAFRAALFAALLVCAATTVASAQTVPSPWTASDVAAPTLSSISSYASGVFTVDAAGNDIWDTADQFHFIYQQVTGDVEIVARVDELTSAMEYAKAGVMIRASLNANAAHGFGHVTRGVGVRFLRRTTNGGTTTALAGPTIAAPVWVRAVRQGTRVTTYSSTNGTSWTTVGSDTIALGSSAYVGIVVNGRSTTARSTARFSNVRITTLGLPSGQSSVDIGAPVIQGSTTYAAGTYTINAAGTDIWDTADQFHFVYQPVTGNTEVIARVASIVNTNSSARGGVMIRESLTASSRHAMAVISASAGYRFQRRPEPGAYSESISGGTGLPPAWVRLVRTGDLFEGYRSTNGTTWTTMGSWTIQMSDTVYVGLAVTSRNAAAATTAVIDNVKITATPTTNQNPAVSITSPATGTQMTMPTTVTIAATATDPENRMTSVDFYAGSTLIVRDTSAPYSATWAPSSAGTYALTAMAYDADGGSSTSSAVNVTVASATKKPNKPPTVSLSSPATGASFTAPASVTLSATASDPENQLARVEFFAGTTKVGTDTTAPYSYSWTNVGAGTYSITAVAYDTAGASATSAARSITVTGTTTTPPRYVVFTASTNHSTSVTSYLLTIFAAGANPATATPITTSDLGKPAPASNGDITVDRGTFFTGLATGSYLATVTAIGPGGQTPSASVTFTR